MHGEPFVRGRNGNHTENRHSINKVRIQTVFVNTSFMLDFVFDLRICLPLTFFNVFDSYVTYSKLTTGIIFF